MARLDFPGTPGHFLPFSIRMLRTVLGKVGGLPAAVREAQPLLETIKFGRQNKLAANLAEDLGEVGHLSILLWKIIWGPGTKGTEEGSSRALSADLPANKDALGLLHPQAPSNFWDQATELDLVSARALHPFPERFGERSQSQ